MFEGSYSGAGSFSAWEDSSGTNRRMLEVRTAKYKASKDDAVVLRCVENGSYYSYEGKLWLARADMPACVRVPGAVGLWQWEEGMG